MSPWKCYSGNRNKKFEKPIPHYTFGYFYNAIFSFYNRFIIIIIYFKMVPKLPPNPLVQVILLLNLESLVLHLYSTIQDWELPSNRNKIKCPLKLLVSFLN